MVDEAEGVVEDRHALTRRPQATAQLLYAYFIEEAWDWQFRGETPPTRLLRHTWRRNAALES